MAKAEYSIDLKAVVEPLMFKMPKVLPGKMFGYPAYYVNGKLMACIVGDGLGLKVPEKLAAELIETGRAVCFQPLGRRRMREWIELKVENPEDILQETALLETSRQYILSLTRD